MLGNLKYDINKDKKLIKRTFDTYDMLLSGNNESISQAVASSIGELYYLGDEAKTRLLGLSRKNIPEISFQISRFLFLQYKNLYNDDGFEQLLLSLSPTKCQYRGIIDNLDHVLYGLLGIEDKQSLAELFFTEWLIKSDYDIGKIRLDSIFGSTLSKLSDNTSLFNSLITKYFNHDNYKINRVASEIIRYSNLHKKRPIILDQAIVKSLGIDDILYICRKILGYLFEVETLCSIIFSILTAKPDDSDAKGLITDIFLNHLGVDFTGTAPKFLQDKLSDTNLSAEIKPAVSDMIDSLKSYQETMNSIPRINELSVSNRMLYQVSVEENKKMQKAMDKAQEGSITSLIATRIPLKYGRSWFNYRNGNYSTPSNLSSFSHSFEIPRSEIDHPVSASMKRAEFRLSRRGDS